MNRQQIMYMCQGNYAAARYLGRKSQRRTVKSEPISTVVSERGLEEPDIKFSSEFCFYKEMKEIRPVQEITLRNFESPEYNIEGISSDALSKIRMLFFYKNGKFVIDPTPLAINKTSHFTEFHNTLGDHIELKGLVSYGLVDHNCNYHVMDWMISAKVIEYTINEGEKLSLTAVLYHLSKEDK